MLFEKPCLMFKKLNSLFFWKYELDVFNVKVKNLNTYENYRLHIILQWTHDVWCKA